MTLTAVLLTALLNTRPDAAVTYSRHIAPIFRERCQECHRPGEVAPMSLLSYDDARPWARSIKKAVRKREMPPWHADPRYGKFANDHRLSDEEVATIVSWVDAGAPRGDPADEPPPKEFVDGWNIGTPDAVFTMPRAFPVPAEGEVPYQYIAIPTNFEEDRWVQAAEVRPGNRSVVHHIIVFVLEPGENRLRGNIWKSHLCGTAPGEGPDVFPPGTGKKVRAGSVFLLQVHYTPNGEATTDQSSVGLIFCKEEPVQPIHLRAAMNNYFRIPPGADKHRVKARYRFREPSKVLALMPHMHLRGRDFKYELVLPDGERRTVLSVPRWDFNWQHNYVLAEPLAVPAGATLECTAHYDNSKNNPANPDPTKNVRWGDQTWEEMMIGFVTFTRDSEAVDRGAADAARAF